MKLTEQQFNEKYGEAMVIFAYYYKYSFSFTGEFNGKKINVTVGGSGDDIYRFDVDASKEYKIKDLSLSYATVKDGETIIDELIDTW